MSDVGSINNVINAISPAITGSVAAEEEEVLNKEEITEKGRKYYQYELLTPFAETGLHNIAKITTSQNYVIMASISASEAQWSANEKVKLGSKWYQKLLHVIFIFSTKGSSESAIIVSC